MPLTSYGAQILLDWLLGGATPTQPPSRWVSFATGTPTEAGASDGAFTPVTMTLNPAAAASPAGSVSNRSVCSCTVSGVAAFTAKGVNLYGFSAKNSRLAYAGIADIGCKSGDTCAFAVGGITVTLA